ncbi:hypothetical protein A3L09_10110 [Thermococcus profundus]|uniref:Glycosyl transferase family 1 domain-containing protein n=1 Tax=Thermococcus profundus TaxID=49899 RepID=A0A2Z2MI41_THEPR|nr:glycosyltransferase family 4 protein [Thermococcus profundus]ASJ03584.1 hypothetical protein A3L09_10110 [Thermococcus profundus]
MEDKNIPIVVVFPFDPAYVESKASGNPATYLRFIKYLLKKREYKVTLIGMKEGEKKFEDENFTFIPIFEKPKNWILFTLKLMFQVPFLKIPDSAVIISSHPAYLLPFIMFKPKNPKVFESVFTHFRAVREENRVLSYLMEIVYNIVEPIFLRYVDIIIASPRYSGYYKNRYLWVAKKIYRMTHESVDTKLFKPLDKGRVRRKYGIPMSSKVILQVAVVNRIKRGDLLIRSFAIVRSMIPNTKLVFVGPVKNYKYKEYLDTLIKELDLNKDVIFMGEFPLKSIPELINCADVLAITSTVETGPLPALEAFACGIPVVSTDVGLVPLLIRNSKLGRLLPANVDEKTFAKALIEVLNENDEKDNRKLKIQRRNIAKEFDIEINQQKRLRACEIAKSIKSQCQQFIW